MSKTKAPPRSDNGVERRKTLVALEDMALRNLQEAMRFRGVAHEGAVSSDRAWNQAVALAINDLIERKLAVRLFDKGFSE